MEIRIQILIVGVTSGRDGTFEPPVFSGRRVMVDHCVAFIAIDSAKSEPTDSSVESSRVVSTRSVVRRDLNDRYDQN